MLSVVVVLAVPPLRLITAIIRMTLDIVSQLFNRLSAGVWLLASGNSLMVSGYLLLVSGLSLAIMEKVRVIVDELFKNVTELNMSRSYIPLHYIRSTYGLISYS